MTDRPAYTLVVLISGSGTNLQAIIDAIQEGLPATIAAVISNESSAYALKRAKQAGIATEVIDHRMFESRHSFDDKLAAVIDSYRPQLIILAGFMRVLGKSFVDHFQDRILNIHPSLLPDYKGLNTHQRVLDDDKTYHGCSVHVVTSVLDSGPIIIQAKIRIKDDDTAGKLQQRVQQMEYKIYPAAIRLFAEGRISIVENNIYIDGECQRLPILVTEED